MKVRTIGTIAGMILFVAFGSLSPAGAQTPSAGCVSQLVAQTGGAQYPPAAARLQVNQSSTSAGGTVVVAGCGTPSGRVTFTLRSHPINLGSATTDGTGFYRASLSIPCDAEQGAHTLSASGAATDSTPLNVSGTTGVCAAAAADTAGSALPRTGSSTTAPLTAAGVGLVLIGAATAITARRRRHAEAV